MSISRGKIVDLFPDYVGFHNWCFSPENTIKKKSSNNLSIKKKYSNFTCIAKTNLRPNPCSVEEEKIRLY